MYTTSEHKNQYNNVLYDVNKFVQDDESIFVSKLACWVYLCTDARCIAPITFRLPLDDYRLIPYFEQYGYPDNVVILDSEYGGFEDNYISTWGENGDLTPNSNIELIDVSYIDYYNINDTASGFLLEK